MKTIQILGSGCARCQKLAAVAEEAARASGAPYELRKVTDPREIAGFGVMSLPALVVDGAVKVTGRVPAVAEVRRWLG